MTVLAVTGFAGLLWVLLVLACPLMMIFMMRGMHGGRGHDGRGQPDQKPRGQMSMDELKEARDSASATSLGDTLMGYRKGARFR